MYINKNSKENFRHRWITFIQDRYYLENKSGILVHKPVNAIRFLEIQNLHFRWYMFIPALHCQTVTRSDDNNMYFTYSDLKRITGYIIKLCVSMDSGVYNLNKN